MPYQDRWVRGRVTTRGYRECATRYALLRKGLGHLRPRTVLDFGAAGGYFSFRLAQDLGADVTAVDDSPELATTAKANGDRRVRLVRRRLNLTQLRGLGHFDVVLALSVLHHLVPWREHLEALRAAARRLLVVELPEPSERFHRDLDPADLAAVHERVRELGGTPIGAAPGVWSKDRRRTLYVLRAPALRGAIFSGSGNCGTWWAKLTGQLERPLGYRPFPGSLNVRLDGGVRALNLLGPPRRTFWDKRRPESGRHGGDYWFWPARFGLGEHALEGHLMIPGSRGHGTDCVELVARVKLREAWGLEDGARLWIRPR
jgi:SAM-dependent methyltransferase